ncbi:hypothetical protein PRK78_003678 [Emydomyces testavorans]|uniref:SP-RING-type domain-containing protein n=1 Tax=Emydomyces testavorans TaxID=2070801 RepID=A0AAF0IHV9_9EURO|nr:hypothetical protein PRK78_003678 [Emydomyces testavorans]
MATATPSSHRSARRQRRESGVGSESPSSADQPIALPPYQRQSHKLNADAKHAIQNIAHSEHFRHLDVHLRNLAAALTSAAGEVHDQLTDAKARCERQKRKREQKEGNEDADGDEDRTTTVTDDAADKHVADLEARVIMTTQKMEKKIRQLVDAEVEIGAMKDILAKIGQSPDESRSRPQARRAPRTRRRRVQDDDDEDENENAAGADHDSNQDENGETEGIVPAIELFETHLKAKETEWENLSLTQRYTTHNTYIGFYRIIHDAKHPGDDVHPLPHPSTWFNHMESPTEASETPGRSQGKKTSTNARRLDHDDDEDVAVQRERISLRCPITLLPFKDPVTSTKCPHSFEREAIEDMVNLSRETIFISIPGTRDGRQRIQCVKCPVCSAQITLQDLRHDPVLLRRVRRAAENAATEEEEEEENDDMQEDEQDVVVGSQRQKSQGVKVKVERARSLTRPRSVVPGTQFETIQEDDDEEDEDEDMVDDEASEEGEEATEPSEDEGDN